MPFIDANGIKICYQEDGARGGTPVLLLHGLGCQLVQWPGGMIDRIIAAGFRVVRMDNRDAGLSSKLDALGSVNIMAFLPPFKDGRPPAPPYTLQDMAGDALAVLDALNIAGAHVVGVSMGGMIAQRIAARHPGRVLSLSSIMSSSGAPNLPAPDPAALLSIMTPPMSTVREEIIAHVQKSWNLIGGAHFKSTEVGMGRSVAAAFDRGRHPPGVLRQLAAVAADVDRAQELNRIHARTLVLHGEVDPLVPLGCGEDTARRISNARLKIIPRMGHDLPDPLITEIVDTLMTHWRTADVV